MGQAQDRLLPEIFSDPGFMPHIHCYLAKPALVGAMGLADLSIGVAYVGISFILWSLVKRIRLPFSWVVFCFGIFIAACGATHFMEVWTLWHPDYWIAAGIKLITAAASVGTGIYLFLLRHSIVKVAAAAQLSERRRQDLESLTQTLADRIGKRTQEFENSELRYRTLTESLPQLVWTCRKDGSCDYLSQQWVNYTGVSEAEQVGLNWLDRVIHPDDRSRTLEHWLGAVAGHHPYDLEYRIRRHDGVYRWFKTRGIPLRDSAGEIVHWFGTCTDVQDQYEIREQLEGSLRTRDEFLSIASHELKTPLTSLKLQLQLVLRNSGTGLANTSEGIRVSKGVQVCLQQTLKLAELVDDLLDVSRIQAGQIDYRFEKTDLVLVVQEAVSRIEEQFRLAGCSLRFEAPGPVVIAGDPFRLDQIITNLLTNALKYGEGRPVQIEVRREGDTAVLSVRDGGQGIPPEKHELIFECFERAVDSKNISGLGLGLYISRQITMAHGGTLEVANLPEGRGAVFTARLPMPRELPTD